MRLARAVSVDPDVRRGFVYEFTPKALLIARIGDERTLNIGLDLSLSGRIANPPIVPTCKVTSTRNCVSARNSIPVFLNETNPGDSILIV